MQRCFIQSLYCTCSSFQRRDSSIVHHNSIAIVQKATHNSLLRGLRIWARSSSSSSIRSRRHFLAPLSSPDLLDTRTFASRFVSIALSSIRSLGWKTFVHIALDIVAVSDGLVEESSGVTFVEGCHDFLAVCIWVSEIRPGRGEV